MRSVTRTSRIARAEGWGVLDVSQGRAANSHPLRATEPFIAWSFHMLDVLMVALAFIFFALSVGYAVACDRL
jgi:hypothetical protein